MDGSLSKLSKFILLVILFNSLAFSVHSDVVKHNITQFKTQIDIQQAEHLQQTLPVKKSPAINNNAIAPKLKNKSVSIPNKHAKPVLVPPSSIDSERNELNKPIDSKRGASLPIKNLVSPRLLKPTTSVQQKSILTKPNIGGVRPLLSPPSVVRQPISGDTSEPHRGFVPPSKLPFKKNTLSKPVLGADGKSLLSPPVDASTLHTLGDEPVVVRGVAVEVDGVVSVPKLSLEVSIWKGNSANILSEVNPNDRINVRATVRNLGSAPTGQVVLHSGRYGDRDFTLSENGVRADEITFDFEDVVTEDHMDGQNTVWFTGSFSLLNTAGRNYNHRVSGQPVNVDKMVSVGGQSSLAITKISNISLTSVETSVSRGYGDLKRIYDGRVDATITIKNTSSQPSEPKQLTIVLASTQDATRPHAIDDNDTVQFLLTKGNGAEGGTQTAEITLPSIPAGGTFNRGIRFSHTLYDLWQYNNKSGYRVLGVKVHNTDHWPAAAGKFACAKPNVGIDRGSAFTITADIADIGTGLWNSPSHLFVRGRFGQDGGYGTLNCTGTIE